MTILSLVKAHGNDQAVGLLEAFLAEARKGRIAFAAVAMIEPPNRAMMDVAGSVAFHEVAKECLRRLGQKLDSDEVGLTMPPRDESLGADYACFNGAFGSLSFDFITWLVNAEMRRVRLGAPAPLKVGFWFGKDGKKGLNLEGRRIMYERVARPAIGLIGGVEDDRARLAHCDEVYIKRPIVEAARAGEAVPVLRAPAWARLDVAPFVGAVTITLRENIDWPHRNSNLKAWLKFARHLRDRGRKVVFVRDTAKAGQQLGEFPQCDLASVDLNIRMALYEVAECNCFVANGPCDLAVFSEKPFILMIKPEPDDSAYVANTAKFWLDYYAMTRSDQFPWSKPDQRILWQTDTFDNLMAAWQSR